MKKFICSLAALMCCFMMTGVVCSCSSDDDDEVQNDSKMVQELSKWLNLDEKGNCPYICNEKSEYFVGADSQNDANQLVKNLSLGASATGSLTLPDDKGTIRVTTPAEPNGIYYDITYNVKGISVQKLSIINNEVLENGGENSPVSSQYTFKKTAYICNNDKGSCGKTFYTIGAATTCPYCKGSVKKKN